MMKCTNENFRNVVCLLRYWPRGDVRGMVAWTNTLKGDRNLRSQSPFKFIDNSLTSSREVRLREGMHSLQQLRSRGR